MFEAAEVGQLMSKEAYEVQLPHLRAKLLAAQFALKNSKIPVIVIISGGDGAGKGEVVHRLNEWLDPRGLDTQAFWVSSDEERERPYYWRYWRVLPPRGRIAIFVSSWYTQPMVQHVYGDLDTDGLDRTLSRIAAFERMLAEDGALILKFALHLSEKAQRRRLKDLRKNPETHWRVLPSDWKHQKHYDKFVQTTERAIRQTDAAQTPWFVVEAADNRYRNFTVGRILLESLQARLAAAQTGALKIAGPPASVPGVRIGLKTILDRVPLNQSLSRKQYEKQLGEYQAKLSRLAWAANEEKIGSVIVFEGWDASGKGSAIRRATEAIDPRLFRLVPIAAPTEEERAQHYLWRFWKHVPRTGLVTIYDRSWYGRVLVERVEGFAKPAEWMRAYAEINEFEERLVEHRIVVTKLWIHISKAEQLRRFKAREQIDYKRHKIGEEDWRNRKKWTAYKMAVNEMVARTSTEFAPWTLIPGNDKKFCRIQVLKTLCENLERVL